MRVTAGHIVPSVGLSQAPPATVAREFRARLAAGAVLRPAGEARDNPERLLASRFAPRHRLSLFDATIYLSNPRQNPDIRFFLAFVVLAGLPRQVYPRIFYKDVSLVWRSASHYVRSGSDTWIGKGEVQIQRRGGYEISASAEETTNLPLEIQAALDSALRHSKRIVRDTRTVELVLRRGPESRIAPFNDFSGPRKRARSDRRNLINRGRRIARFTRRGVPESLVFAPGFEPDFQGGIVDVNALSSRLYGGRVERYRVVSRNEQVQYLFCLAPHVSWVGACQPTTREITSYGVRSIDALVDEEFLLPGYEYHQPDENGHVPDEVRQVPEGFEGATSAFDASRVDTSPWLNRVPAIREFRRIVGSGKS